MLLEEKADALREEAEELSSIPKELQKMDPDGWLSED